MELSPQRIMKISMPMADKDDMPAAILHYHAND